MKKITAPISFREFVRLGSHQAYGQSNPLVALFFRRFGPLGTHARIRNTRLIHTLAGIDLSGMRVLDVGCGHGYTLFWLAEHFPQMQLEGIDTDAPHIAGCQLASQVLGFSNLHFRLGNPYDLPTTATYDLLIAIDVLEHLPDDAAGLAAMVTALKPGGYLAVHVPLRHQIQNRIIGAFRSHTVSDHARDEYLPEEIVERVTQAGLEIQEFTYGFGYWGELSFELNNLFWRNRWLRYISALTTLPLALVLGYRDACQHLVFGNSMVLLARRPTPQTTNEGF